MGEDWEKLLDGALERKRALGKVVRFTELKAAPEEGPDRAPEAPSSPEPPPAGNDEVEHLQAQARLLGQKVQELTEENRRLRSELESHPAGRAAPQPADGEEVERLRRKLNDAREVIKSIEAAYRMGRRRSRR